MEGHAGLRPVMVLSTCRTTEGLNRPEEIKEVKAGGGRLLKTRKSVSIWADSGLPVSPVLFL